MPETRIEKFMRLLSRRCRKLVNIGANVILDESLLGRTCFKEPTQEKGMTFFAVKLFVLSPCIEKLNGYSWNFCAYYG